MLGVAHYLGIEVIFDKSPEIARQTIEEMGQLYIHGLGEMQRPDESASVR